jgi:adenylate cyclase
VIVGEIGYRDHMVFTALGDAVNVAARLQDMTKSLGCEVIISDQVCVAAGLAADALDSLEVEIRGRTEPMHVRTAETAKAVATLLEEREVIAV